MDDCDGHYCNDPSCIDRSKNLYKMSDEMYCLTCHHEASMHAEMQDKLSRFIYWLINKKGCTVGPWCKCDKLIPSDNLRYLEELSR